VWRDNIYLEICSWESQGGLTIQRLCELAGVSRASFYRDWEQKAPSEAEVALRDAVQRMALNDRTLGYRRITPLLQRAGFVVGREKVRRIMRTDNLMAVRRRKFVVTTDSNHRFRVYPNLAELLEVTAVNQLWVADLTYIRLRQEFVFLALVLDAFSRKVIGWELGRTLETRLPLRALEAALASRQPKPGLVHHSDRGTQYASNEYVKRLEASGIQVSMSRAGRPWENGKCESFIKTLKREEIDARPYRTMDELRQHLAEFMNEVYNVVRLHSALGYRSPQEVEQAENPGTPWSPGALSFLRHEEIYPDV
jgi:transposase InsO family protein